jgi:hypothetical protein
MLTMNSSTDDYCGRGSVHNLTNSYCVYYLRDENVDTSNLIHFPLLLAVGWCYIILIFIIMIVISNINVIGPLSEEIWL